MTTSNGPEVEGKPEFRLTGRHVLLIIISVFSVVFSVNIYMVWRAVGSHPGSVTESSYRDSQHFNGEIAAGRAQAERGWTVTAATERSSEGKVKITVEARDAKGLTLPGVTFNARLEHPANRHLDRHTALAPISTEGLYEGFVADVAPGKWTLVVEGNGNEGRLFRSNTAIMLH
jgi:nitrogen fixation protein FixH